MEKKLVESVPGTQMSLQNGHLLISSGITSLDDLLGGGLPVGTVALIEEDFHGLYSKVVLKYFLAEGIVSKHSVLIASQDVNPAIIIKELPAVIETDPEQDLPMSQGPDLSQHKMKIAFRYQNIASNQRESTNFKHINHHFDLSKHISFQDIENSDIYYWTGQRIEAGPNNFANPAYNDLLKSIKEKIKDGKFFLKDNPEKRTILRIGVHSLGSPMWLPHRKSIRSLDNNSRDLDMFVFCLRALVRSANAVALITVPSYLYHELSLERCIHSSDIAMRLQSFSGTELENNQSLQDYHGFFNLTKLAAINSLASKHPGSVEYVFKLRRKKFSIEMLHLPPEHRDKEKKAMIVCRDPFWFTDNGYPNLTGVTLRVNKCIHILLKSCQSQSPPYSQLSKVCRSLTAMDLAAMKIQGSKERGKEMEPSTFKSGRKKRTDLTDIYSTLDTQNISQIFKCALENLQALSLMNEGIDISY